MSKTTTININIEPTLKKEVEEILSDFGLNISDAIRIYLKQIVLTNSIPFSIPLNIKKSKFNKETLDAIAEADKIMENPENYKSYSDVYEILEEIEHEE